MYHVILTLSGDGYDYGNYTVLCTNADTEDDALSEAVENIEAQYHGCNIEVQDIIKL